MSVLSFLDKDRSVAGPGYNRWLVPPAALAIHLSIGQVYAWSVLKKPLTTLLGHGTHAAGDWTDKQVMWTFSIAIGVLGLSAALFGRWLERNGPRKAMFLAACCFGLGFLVAAVGVHLHQLWVVYLGYGAIGGIGLGLGYLAPVANLVKWFNDRPGLATGMAIMGFGGGAMIGGPLATNLIAHFKTADHSGVSTALCVMGALYFAFMMFGVFTIRIPPPDWKPAAAPAATPTKASANPARAKRPPGVDVDVSAAIRTPQFYLLWLVLCLNTTAGISIIEQGSEFIPQLFAGHFTANAVAVAAGTGYVGVLSLFNMGGRFVWSSLSDYVGRKATFAAFFVVGAAGYAAILFTAGGHLDSIALFVAVTGVLISIYGGGFSTTPAYVRDLFGTKAMNAIYGRILTAWSVAGIAGPYLLNTLHDSQVARHVPVAQGYATIFHIMAGLLVVGLIANLLIRPAKPAA